MDKTVKAEFCVVGSGAAGAVLATELARSGKHVVLLEQGKAYGPEVRSKLTDIRARRLINETVVDFSTDWPAEFSNASPVNIGRDSATGLSAVGGTTLHWNGMCPRPREDEMRVRSQFGYGRDYPISYQEIEPWLVRAEHELGVAGDADNPYASSRSGPFPMPGHKHTEFESNIFEPAAKRLGWATHSLPWAINSRPYDDRGECVRCRYCTACPSGAKYSPDRSHLLRFVKFPNAELLAETKLLRLGSSTNGRRIDAAHAVQRDGTRVVVKADRYVLAMGGIETPRMLLHSTDGHHKNGLGNAGGQLGVGHSDHYYAFGTIVPKASASHTYGYPTITTDHHRAQLDRRKHGGFFVTLWPPGLSEGGTSVDLLVKNATTPKSMSLASLRGSASRSILGVAFVEMDAANTLTLDPEKKDSWGMPLPRLTWKVTDRDRAALDASSKAFEGLGNAMNAEAMSTGWSTGEYWYSQHPGGSAAMGSSPDKGACDANCRVFGTDNLYLAGSAIFPHQPANNPTLSITAYALRLAKHLGAS